MLGWVLAGGGAMCAWQYGVMSDLWDRNLRPVAVSGVSGGALNGIGLLYRGISGLGDFWNQIDGRNSVWSFNLNPFSLGIYNSKPLRKIIDRVIDGKPANTFPVHVCYVDATAGQVIYANSQTASPAYLRMAVEASAAIPFLVDPVGGSYIDGGVMENCPLAKLIQVGCTDIIIISPTRYPLDRAQKARNKREAIYRMVALARSRQMAYDLHICQTRNAIDPAAKKIRTMFIQPPRSYDGSPLDFSKAHIQAAIEIGRAWQMNSFASFGE